MTPTPKAKISSLIGLLIIGIEVQRSRAPFVSCGRLGRSPSGLLKNDILSRGVVAKLAVVPAANVYPEVQRPAEIKPKVTPLWLCTSRSSQDDNGLLVGRVGHAQRAKRTCVVSRSRHPGENTLKRLREGKGRDVLRIKVRDSLHNLDRSTLPDKSSCTFQRPVCFPCTPRLHCCP